MSSTASSPSQNGKPVLSLDLFGRLPPWKLPRIIIGMHERPTWVIMKPSFSSFVDGDRGGNEEEKKEKEKEGEEEEEEKVDEEDVVRHYHQAFTVVDILRSRFTCNHSIGDSDDYEHEHDHGAAPEGSIVPHIAAFESKAFANWVRVTISADPSWKEARLRRVSLTRLVEVCDTFRIPRVALFQASFLRGITCRKL